VAAILVRQDGFAIYPRLLDNHHSPPKSMDFHSFLCDRYTPRVGSPVAGIAGKPRGGFMTSGVGEDRQPANSEFAGIERTRNDRALRPSYPTTSKLRPLDVR